MGNTRKWNEILRHERVSHNWTQAQIAQALRVDTKRVSEWEGGKTKPSYKYRAKLQKLFKLSAEEFGFLDDEAAIDDEAPPERGTSPAQPLESIDLDGQQPLQLFIPKDITHAVTIYVHQQGATTSSSFSEEHGIIDDRSTNASGQEHPDGTETIVKRREFFQEGLRIVGVTALTPNDLINSELVERFLRALKKPSTIDERTLHYFELRTETYWQDRHSAALASSDLLSYVIEHLQKVMTLLEGSLFPTIRTRLCCIASGIAQLAGHLLFDMGEFAHAQNFHQIAITAAQEGTNQALEAVAWGRMSFTWTYSGNTPAALRCIQWARHLAAENVNTPVRAYLAAVEAEIQAILGSSRSCLKALEIAEFVEDRQYPREEMYWLHFDRSRLAGYQGICFRRLYHPEDARTSSFLDEAQRALTDALALLDPGRIQRRPTLLIDIAGTYAQGGDVERACGHATQALSIMAQTKSQTVAKRLLRLRQELEPWKETQYVKNLDQQMRELITPRAYRGIA